MLAEVFIIIILLWFWCFDLPADLPQRRLAWYIQKSFMYLGLWHGWAMFAPEPLHVNRRFKAMLHYADGTVEEWRPIEPLQTNWFIDLLWFRHFKFQFSVLTGSEKALWPPLCEWLDKIQETRFRCKIQVQDSGCKIQGARFRVQDSEGKIQVPCSLSFFHMNNDDWWLKFKAATGRYIDLRLLD